GHLFTESNSNNTPYRIDQIDDGAAKQAGVQVGDELVSVDGENVDTFAKLQHVLSGRANKDATLVLNRRGQTLTLPVHLGEKDGHGILGIELHQLPAPLQRVNPVTAAGRTVTELGTL